MKYLVTAQSDDNSFEVNADNMKQAYDAAEQALGKQLDGNINDDNYSVAEASDDYYTIAKTS